MRIAPGAAALALSVGAASTSCGSPKVECSCTDPSFEIRVPSARAAYVVDVQLSGTACVGGTASCASSAADAGLAGCTDIRFRATAPGNCHVDVDFSGGPSRFSADARVVNGGCCGGFYADPPSAAVLEVPPADGG